MRVVEYSAAGGPEVLALAERERPVAGNGEVLIKVAAFGLNRADVQQRRGVYPPPPGASDIPGLEVSGTIAALGSEATGFSIGDEVCALLTGGGYAEYVAAPEAQVLPIPAGVGLIDAAGLPEVVATVWSNLFMEAGVQAGDNVLIHGGSGGIGSMAIQLVAGAGASAIVTCGSAEKIAHCLRLGARAGINYREQDFVAELDRITGGAGADVILDVVGAKYLEQNVKALAPDGRLVVIGLQGGATAELNLGVLMGKRARIIGTTLRSRVVSEKGRIMAELREEVWPLLENGSVLNHVDRRFSLQDYRSAHEYFDSGLHRGKILITV
ncbi:NAD(P)H-quinone oxidoreductase [Paeniglutamicibacter cryotolerans]|nr:NAD(P)H-quinone oxidoreductase [Paeniglutamicibacter cryotolerans]